MNYYFDTFLFVNSKKPFRIVKFIRILNPILTWLTYDYFHLQTLLSLFIKQWLWDKKNFKFSFTKVKIFIREIITFPKASVFGNLHYIKIKTLKPQNRNNVTLTSISDTIGQSCYFSEKLYTCSDQVDF